MISKWSLPYFTQLSWELINKYTFQSKLINCIILSALYIPLFIVCTAFATLSYNNSAIQRCLNSIVSIVLVFKPFFWWFFGGGRVWKLEYFVSSEGLTSVSWAPPVWWIGLILSFDFNKTGLKNWIHFCLLIIKIWQ